MALGSWVKDGCAGNVKMEQVEGCKQSNKSENSSKQAQGKCVFVVKPSDSAVSDLDFSVFEWYGELDTGQVYSQTMWTWNLPKVWGQQKPCTQEVSSMKWQQLSL